MAFVDNQGAKIYWDEQELGLLACSNEPNRDSYAPSGRALVSS